MTISADICTSGCGSCEGSWDAGCFHCAISECLRDLYIADMDYCWLDGLVDNKYSYGYDYFTDEWVTTWIKDSKMNIKALDTLADQDAGDDYELDLDDDELKRIYEHTARALNFWLWHTHFPTKSSYETWLANATQ